MIRNTSPQSDPQSGLWAWLWSILRPHGVRMAVAGVAVVGAATSLLGLARSAQFLVDKSLHDPSGHTLNMALLAMVGCALAMAVSSFYRATSVNILADIAEKSLRRQVFERLLRLDADYHARHETGDLTARLGVEIGHIQNLINVALPNGMRNALLLIGGLGLMAATSLKLCLLTLLAVPLLSVPVALIAPRLRRMNAEMGEVRGQLFGFLSERLAAMRTTQLHAAEHQLMGKLDRLHEDGDAAHARVYRTRGMMVGIIIVIVFMLIGIVLWSGGRMVLEGAMTQGQIAAFVMYAIIAAGALATLTDLGTSIGQARASLQRLHEIMAAPIVIASPSEPRAVLGQTPRITFDRVTFRYPQAQTPTLENISFVVEPNETVALVGPSGAGKSTIFSLLARFYDPQDGAITLDGVDLRDMDLRELRHLFGVIPQEPDIFAMTIMENIAFGLDDTDRAVIEHAARQANAAEFIERLPARYDTRLAERGVGLSVGQKQRLAIARALVRDPKILLMDEATSALDAESERLVQEALIGAAKGRTAIVIAHRLATIRSAHRILVFDKGRLVATGTHETLMAANGLYAHLAGLQFLE